MLSIQARTKYFAAVSPNYLLDGALALATIQWNIRHMNNPQFEQSEDIIAVDDIIPKEIATKSVPFGTLKLIFRHFILCTCPIRLRRIGIV